MVEQGLFSDPRWWAPFPVKNLGKGNHPVGSDNEWSFSKADIDLFTLYELSVLRGIDEKYVYELNRFLQDIDKMPTFAEAEELVFRHSMVIQEAKRRGFGYRRWKR